MKNILAAAIVVAMGSVGMAASANAVPAASLAGIGEQAGSATEQVGFRHRYGKKWHGYGFRHGYGYGYGGGYYGFKKWCYHHPYHWKCKHYGWGY